MPLENAVAVVRNRIGRAASACGVGTSRQTPWRGAVVQYCQAIPAAYRCPTPHAMMKGSVQKTLHPQTGKRFGGEVFDQLSSPRTALCPSFFGLGFSVLND